MKLLPTSDQLNTFLVRSKICDPDGTFSHTSLLLLVAIVRLAIFPADAYTVGILSLALLHANAKRYQAHKANEKSVSDKDKLAKVEKEVQNLLNIQSVQNLNRR